MFDLNNVEGEKCQDCRGYGRQCRIGKFEEDRWMPHGGPDDPEARGEGHAGPVGSRVCPTCCGTGKPIPFYHLQIAWSRDSLSKDTKHLALHVAKIAGALAAYEEEYDHRNASPPGHPGRSLDELDRMKEDFLRVRIPDLVILAAMYAAAWEGDLEKLVSQRSREILMRARGNAPTKADRQVEEPPSARVLLHQIIDEVQRVVDDRDRTTEELEWLRDWLKEARAATGKENSKR